MSNEPVWGYNMMPMHCSHELRITRIARISARILIILTAEDMIFLNPWAPSEQPFLSSYILYER